MTARADIRAEADRLRQGFEARGAELFETGILQPADTLLELYGEEIRARAFVTQDPLRGEMMLRPDFTVPLVEAHMAAGRGAARYTYSGEVFRRQEEDDTRPTEYLQVGYEIFGETNAARAEAEVFAAMADALAGLPVRAATGDIGVIRAAIMGLDTPERRKVALLRHLWHPARFHALLDRYSRPALPPPAPPVPDVTHVGLRGLDEVAERLGLLAEEVETSPIPATAVDRLNAILAVSDMAPAALKKLRSLVGDDATLGEALAGIEARLDALASAGIDPAAISFEANYGRTSLEYYGGFVFGFAAEGATGLPGLATGGRYDLLTEALGRGRAVPAVGGVLRPAAVLALRERDA